jgi:hypothetical protein
MLQQLATLKKKCAARGAPEERAMAARKHSYGADVTARKRFVDVE